MWIAKPCCPAIERENCPSTALPEWERAIHRQVGLLAGLSTGEVAAHIDAPLDTLLDSLMAVEFVAWLGQRLGIQVDGLLQPQDTLRSVLARLEAHLQDGMDWEVEQAPAYWSGILHAEPSAEPESEVGKKMLPRTPVGDRRPPIPPLFRLPGQRPRALATRSALPDCRQSR